MNKKAQADHWTIKAKKLGYPARSVFKLSEIQQKWKPLRRGMNVLDIGSAPGSWTLFALETLGGTATVCSVDLQPMVITPPPGSRLRFLQADVFSPQALMFIDEGKTYGCILSDAAPSTSGNRLVDAGKSYSLAVAVLDLCQKHLAGNGSLVVKVFQGGDEGEIRFRMKTMFHNVKTFRPQAVRRKSMEVYMIGLGLRRESV